jgi:Tfp pilus assembly protein PilF
MTRCGAAFALALSLVGCVTQEGLSDVMQRPAERALLAGMRAYDDGQYAEAERELKRSLEVGLVSAKDRANAHKHLAFIYCTSNRAPACERSFRDALSADAFFALSKAEAGGGR